MDKTGFTLLAAIIASSEDAIISKTLDGIITSWNPAAEKLFGYTEEEVVGQHISLIIPKDRLNEEAYIIGQVSQGKQIDHFETVRRSKQGELMPLSLSVSPIKNTHGRIIGASKIARDITDRIKANEKQAVLSAIIDNSDDAIISKTLEGIITSWNPAAGRLFGYTAFEAIGQHISLIIPPDRLSEETLIISNIANGKKVDNFETIRVAKGGRHVPISVTVSPVADQSGKIIGASKIARDISGLLASQAEKEQLYQQVKALNEKKDEFIGLASHELKTPLTSINGYLQILSRIIMDEKGQQFLEKARLQVKKLSALVSDLLDVSKIEAGKLQLTVEKFNIREVVDDAVELIAHTTHYHITLETGISELFISGDPHRIEQLIINLLTNAIRYSPGANRVGVFLQLEGAELKIGVKDFGIGIPADKLKNIFTKFYRVDDSNSHISGLGIGLYLSHEIVSRHHGRIWAESEPGKGSTFWFTLPI
jgi:PAS domain S-box-containing protein